MSDIYVNGSYVYNSGRELKLGDIVRVSYGFHPAVSTFDGGHDVIDAEHYEELLLVDELCLLDPTQMDPASPIAIYEAVGDYVSLDFVGTATENLELLSEVKNWSE